MCKSKPEFAQGLSQSGSEVAFGLSVLVVNDPKFKTVSPKDAETSLTVAYQTLAERYPGLQLSTSRLDFLDTEDFFNQYKSDETKPGRYFSLKPGSEAKNKRRFKKQLPKIIEHLKEEDSGLVLRNVPDDIKKEIRTNKQPFKRYAKFLFKKQQNRIERYQKKKLKKNRLLDSSPQHSLNSWVNTMFEQGDYDLVLTNTFIFNDDLTIMDPQTVIHGFSHGGLATFSPDNQNLEGRSAFASFFFLYDGPKVFGKQSPKKLSRKKRNEIIGTNLIAHELAHYLFLLPDFDNHPEYCLLNAAQADYVATYEYYQQNKRPCPVCRPYVEARLKALQGYIDYRQGSFSQAQKNLRAGKNLSPGVQDFIKDTYLEFLDSLIKDSQQTQSEPQAAETN